MHHRLATAVVVAVLVATACNSAASAQRTTVPTTDPPTTTTTTPNAINVFDDVSPAIAFVETDIATGSGILIDHDLVLTAAHVVWPRREVRVVFPNGEHTDTAPVIGTDPVADLALIDVSNIARQPEPVVMGDGETLPIGSTVYMVGYPAEPERNPAPTISEGILSRVREWPNQDWTFLQSDAAVVGGQSGGALVDAAGEVIGVTNFQLATEYGLSGSISDAVDRIDSMRNGTDSYGLGDRLPPISGADKTQQVTIEHFWDQQVLVFEAPLFTEIEVSTNTNADTAIQLMSIDGFPIAYADDNVDSGETAVGQVIFGGPHLAVITAYDAEPVDELIVGSVKMIPWEDPDDGQTLHKPDRIYGNLDFAGDIDWYWVELGDGQSITVNVDSVTVDTALYIDSLDNPSEFSLAYDDNSGGGTFGSNPRLVYTAEETKTYLVVVTDEFLTGPGAYELTVE